MQGFQRATTFALILAGLGAAACVGTDPPRSQFPTADDALSRMKATYACVNGLQGEAKIDHLSPQGRVRGDLFVLTLNPDRVRFAVVSPFGPTLFLLTSDGKEFRLLDIKENQFLQGPPSACNLARMTQVPIPGHALVSILRGEAPVLVHTNDQASIAWDRKAGLYKLMVNSKHDAVEEVHIEVHPDDFDKPWGEQRVRVRKVRVAQLGIDLFDAALSKHVPTVTADPRMDEDGLGDPIPPSGGVCNAELPRKIEMLVPGKDEDVSFNYKDKEVKWNPPIIEGAFTQVEPGGVRKIFVDCAETPPAAPANPASAPTAPAPTAK